VVLVNSPSSVGKSSIADALQAALPEPFLVLGLDTFLATVPATHKGPASSPDGFQWIIDADLTPPLRSCLQIRPRCTVSKRWQGSARQPLSTVFENG
jgi:chloramphenicol 3-O-phosphotransferase